MPAELHQLRVAYHAEEHFRADVHQMLMVSSIELDVRLPDGDIVDERLQASGSSKARSGSQLTVVKQ